MKQYPAYKDSGVDWIGEIPNHWNYSRTKYVVGYEKGRNPKELDFIETPWIYLTMEYLRGNPKQVFYVADNSEFVTVDDNEILLLWDGSNAGEFIRSRAGVLSSTMALLKIRNSHSNYAWYYLKAFERILKDYTIGMGIPHVNGDEFRNNLFLIPQIDEQSQIVIFLDYKTHQIDDLVAKKQKLIELLKEERTAIINQAITKGLDPTVPMKDSEIEWLGEIPEHWEVKKVKQVLKNLDFKRIPLSSEERGKMTLKTFDYYGASGVIDKVDNYLFDGEYILIGEDGANILTRSCAMAYKATGRFWVNNHAHILQPYEGMVDYFVNLLEQVDYSYYASGSAQPKLTQDKLENISITVPPVEDQIEIVKFLETKCSHIDSVLSRITKEIELISEYKTSLINEAVTGKIDVRDYQINHA